MKVFVQTGPVFKIHVKIGQFIKSKFSNILYHPSLIISNGVIELYDKFLEVIASSLILSNYV